MSLTKDEIIDKAAERNARLIVQLRHITRLYHNKFHTPGINWTECAEENCIRTAELLKEPRRCLGTK